MGATNFLAGIIHAFVSTLYLYTWYWTGFNIWQRFFHRDRRRFVHFVSWWTFLCQTMYFVIVFCCDLVKVVTPPSCMHAYRFLDYFFSGLVLPSAINSFLLFWISHFFLRYPAPFYASLIKPQLFTTITNLNTTTSLTASQHNQVVTAQSAQTQGSKDASSAATPSGVKFPVARTVSDTDQPNQAETKRPFDISSGSCLNVEHDESKVVPSVSVDIRSAASSEAVGNPINQSSKTCKTGQQFLSPTDYNSSRHFSMDSRSEHSEFLTCGVAGSVLNCRSASVGSAMMPKDDASLVLHMRIRPRENTDLSLIIPSHNHSIPTWVLHVTHSAVGLSALLETLLSPPTSTLNLIPNILASALLPLAYFTFISIKLLLLEPTAKTTRTTGGGTTSQQQFWTNLSFLAIFVGFVANCAVCATAAVASVYLNSWSNFLHTYISMGFESAVVMQ